MKRSVNTDKDKWSYAPDKYLITAMRNERVTGIDLIYQRYWSLVERGRNPGSVYSSKVKLPWFFCFYLPLLVSNSTSGYWLFWVSNIWSKLSVLHVFNGLETATLWSCMMTESGLIHHPPWTAPTKPSFFFFFLFLESYVFFIPSS